jgi:hypothetical protein
VGQTLCPVTSAACSAEVEALQLEAVIMVGGKSLLLSVLLCTCRGLGEAQTWVSTQEHLHQLQVVSLQFTILTVGSVCLFYGH